MNIGRYRRAPVIHFHSERKHLRKEGTAEVHLQKHIITFLMMGKSHKKVYFMELRMLLCVFENELFFIGTNWTWRVLREEKEHHIEESGSGLLNQPIRNELIWVYIDFPPTPSLMPDILQCGLQLLHSQQHPWQALYRAPWPPHSRLMLMRLNLTLICCHC